MGSTGSYADNQERSTKEVKQLLNSATRYRHIGNLTSRIDLEIRSLQEYLDTQKLNKSDEANRLRVQLKELKRIKRKLDKGDY